MSYRLSERTVSSIPRLLDGIRDGKQWEEKRERIRADWLHLLGTSPVTPTFSTSAESRPSSGGIADAGEYKVTLEEEGPGYKRREIRYGTVDGDEVCATLLLPDASRYGTAPRPAVLALHPTAPEGRLDTATSAGRDNRRYGLELAQRGYVVLAPDSITCGSRIYAGTEAFQTAPFYTQHPGWTAVGKMLSDHHRAVDVLSALPEVDEARIGVIGHSLGGYNGWFLAAADKRIKAVASSCGFSMFTGDPDPNRWGQREWFSHLPAVTEMLKQDTIPFEWHEVAALAAPTPLWMWSGMKDKIFPNWPSIAAGMDDLGTLYEWLDRGEDFECWLGNAGHDFPQGARELAYSFLDRHLQAADE